MNVVYSICGGISIFEDRSNINIEKQKKLITKGTVRLLTLGLTLIWGIAWVFMKVALQYMGPFTFATLRFMSAALFLIIVLAFLRRLKLQNISLRELIILGLLQTTSVFLLLTYGMKFVDARTSSILLYTMPIWSGLLAAKFLGQPLSRVKIFAMFLGGIGIFFIVDFQFESLSNRSALLGQFMILIASVCWAFANIYYQRKFQFADRLQVNAYQSLFGALALAIFAFITEANEPIVFNSISLLSVLYTGVFASAISFTIWFFLLDVVDTATAAMSILLVPLFGLIFGAIFLNETLTISTIIGSFFILAGVFFVQFNGIFRSLFKKRSLPNKQS